jgi:hypothetical protein
MEPGIFDVKIVTFKIIYQNAQGVLNNLPIVIN